MKQRHGGVVGKTNALIDERMVLMKFPNNNNDEEEISGERRRLQSPEITREDAESPSFIYTA